jgi:hemerythrin HHE cation binding domain-containing protein
MPSKPQYPWSRTRSSSYAEVESLSAGELLKADHREIERMFEEYQLAESVGERHELAMRICKALTILGRIEEEIFYPAFLEATGNNSLHHAAVIELEVARDMMARIEANNPRDDPYFDARMQVLAQLMRHHMNEAEQSGGLFDESESAGMDLEALGAALNSRRSELLADEDSD